MYIQVGDYVEGYRMEKYELRIQYTRGWVVYVEYEHNKLSYILVNEDIPFMLNKYWPDKDNKEQEFEMTHVCHLDSMLLVVGDSKYQIRKVNRQERWGYKNFRYRDKIEAKAAKTEIMPYYADKSMFKLIGVAKVFTLDGVLQVPNSSYTDKINDIEYENQPIRKMLEYIEKYSVRHRRLLLVNVPIGRDIDKALKGKVNQEILDLFDRDKIEKACTFERKACLLDELASSMPNGEDVLLIDHDIKLVKKIQDGKLFPKQARNLKAVHISALMDLKI